MTDVENVGEAGSAQQAGASGPLFDAISPTIPQPVRPALKPAFALNPDMTLPEAFLAFGSAYAGAFSQNLALLMDGGGPGALHQSRICIRRLRTLLSLFKPALRPEHRRALQLELKWASDLLGQARELDVLVERILLPAIRANADVPGFDALREAVGRMQASARDATLPDLHSPRMSGLTLDLARRFGTLGPARLSEEWLPLFHKAESEPFLLSRLRSWLDSLLADSDSMSTLGVAQLHRIRVRMKKLRYATEAVWNFTGVHGEHLACLISIQESLGQVNDGRVSRELLLGYAAGLLPRNDGERASLIAAGVAAANSIAGEAAALAKAQAARDLLATASRPLSSNAG